MLCVVFGAGGVSRKLMVGLNGMERAGRISLWVLVPIPPPLRTLKVLGPPDPRRGHPPPGTTFCSYLYQQPGGGTSRADCSCSYTARRNCASTFIVAKVF